MIEKIALLLVDAQVGLLEGRSAVYDASNLLKRLQILVDCARDQDVPIVYVQDVDVAPEGSVRALIHPNISPEPEDRVIVKTFSDSFYQTSLHKYLTGLEIDRLIIAGCTTDSCIAMTAQRAVSLGYQVTLASDGHSTHDNEFMTAEKSIAYYNRLLDGFGSENGFGNGECQIIVQPVDKIEFRTQEVKHGTKQDEELDASI